MTDRHEHDYFRTPTGALVCACGASYRPLTFPDQTGIDTSEES